MAQKQGREIHKGLSNTGLTLEALGKNKALRAAVKKKSWRKIQSQLETKPTVLVELQEQWEKNREQSQCKSSNVLRSI